MTIGEYYVGWMVPDGHNWSVRNQRCISPLAFILLLLDICPEARGITLTRGGEILLKVN